MFPGSMAWGRVAKADDEDAVVARRSNIQTSEAGGDGASYAAANSAAGAVTKEQDSRRGSAGAGAGTGGRAVVGGCRGIGRGGTGD